MKRQFSGAYPQKRVQIVLLLGFCLVLYFINLGQWDLWNPDEPRYAQVAKEMVSRGDWILMHYNGKVYPDKPPLFFWLVALSSYLWQGFGPFSVRFIPALFGTLTVLLTFLLGRNLYASRTGLLSGLILATSAEFTYLSTRGNIDTTLTFFTTASIYFFLKWYRASKGEEGQGLAIYGFYLGMALATLAKGPVGFILPLLVGLVYLAIQRDWKGIKGMKLFPGMLLFVGIVLSWYLPAVVRGGSDYLNMTLLTHTVDRFSEGWAKPRPIYYYFYNFPIDFLPWILFLPGAIAYGYSREMVEKRKDFLLLVIWFAVTFLFFSFSKGKRGVYLLPLYPAAALMVGKVWDDFISGSMDHFKQEWMAFPLHGFMGLALLAGAAIPWAVSMRFRPFLPYSLPIAFLLVGGSLATFVLYRFRNYGAILCLIVGIVTAGYFYAGRVIFPLANPFKSARFLSEEITSRILPGERLGVYGRVGAAAYNFYTGIVPIAELNTNEELRHFLGSSERVFCLLPFRDFVRFQKMEERPRVELIARRKVGDIDIVLISNR